MSYSATVIEIFLSSPSDVTDERLQVRQIAEEWNRLRSRATGCHLSVLTWESVVAPALSDRAQQVVNDQVGFVYDVYLGMMSTRLGSSTGKFESGTVEEFEVALSRAKRGEAVRIACLFKRTMVDSLTADLEQIAAIQKFRARLGDEGAFHRDFTDQDSLRSILNILFEQIASSKSMYSDNVLVAQQKAEHNNINNLVLDFDDEDIGLIEVGEQFERLVAEFVDNLTIIGNAENANTEVIRDCTQRVSSMTVFGNFDKIKFKAIVRDSATSMSNLARQFAELYGPVSNNIRSMTDLVEKDLSIRLELTDPTNSSSAMALEDFIPTVRRSHEALEESARTTASLPRLSVKLAKARRLLVAERERMRDLFISFERDLTTALESFKEKATR